VEAMVEIAANADGEFGFRTWLGRSWAIVCKHWFLLLTATFVRELLSIVAAGLVFAIFIDLKGWNILIALVVRCVVWSALQAGYLKLCLNVCQNDKVQWKDLFSGLSFSLQMLIATACLWIAIILGLIVLVIPGLLLSVRLSLYGFVLVDQRSDALRSLLSSYRMLKGFARYAAVSLIVYLIGSTVAGILFPAFQLLSDISLCALYKHICGQEVKV